MRVVALLTWRLTRRVCRGTMRSMCGRIAFTQPKKVRPSLFGLDVLPELAPRYNLAPSQSLAAIRGTPQGRELVYLKWGLLPAWAKDPQDTYKSINARAETVAEKPSFRSAFKHRRCLILADAFYEWQKTEDGGKQPHCIRMPDSSPFALAGLWEHWEKEGEIIESGAIITTTANAQMKPLHERMPVILAAADFDLWLDLQRKDPQDLLPLLAPFTGELHIYPVNRAVNNPRNDDPRCLDAA